MSGPVLLTHFNHLAKSARETGDNCSYVEQALAFFSHGKAIDSRLSSKLSHRLIAAEDRYRDNLPPFLNEMNVATAFNALRSTLINSEDYPSVEAHDVNKYRRFLSLWGNCTELFPLEKANYSPIEAILLLFLIATSDGRIDVSGIAVESFAAQGSRSCAGVIARNYPASSIPQFLDSWKSHLASRFKWISQRKIEKSFEIALKQLNI